MKLSLLLSTVCLLCTPLLAAESAADRAKAEVIAADKAFCAQAGKDGLLKAFRDHTAEDTKFLGSPTLLGLPAAQALYGAIPKDATLTWEPQYAFASASGDLAYTYGRYLYTQPIAGKPAHTASGTYVTVWKRRADGSWRIAVDGGEPDPKPGA